MASDTEHRQQCEQLLQSMSRTAQEMANGGETNAYNTQHQAINHVLDIREQGPQK